MPFLPRGKDLIRIYREEGLTAAVKSPFTYAYSSVFEGVRYQTDRRVDLEQRWELMHPEIADSDSSLLDVGCAEGALTERFSDEGLFCLGVDVLESRLAPARKRESPENDVRFINYEVTPTNVGKLPTFDVVLLLTVYYHWCREYGQGQGELMLKTLANGSHKLFFQPPGGEFENHPFDESEFDTTVEGYETYLDELFGGRVGIELLGETDYRGGERRDPLFVLRCGEYQRGSTAGAR